MAMNDEIKIHECMTVRDIFEMGFVNPETSISFRDEDGCMYHGVVTDPWVQKHMDDLIWGIQWIPDENRVFIDCKWPE